MSSLEQDQLRREFEEQKAKLLQKPFFQKLREASERFDIQRAPKEQLRP